MATLPLMSLQLGGRIILELYTAILYAMPVKCQSIALPVCTAGTSLLRLQPRGRSSTVAARPQVAIERGAMLLKTASAAGFLEHECTLGKRKGWMRCAVLCTHATMYTPEGLK